MIYIICGIVYVALFWYAISDFKKSYFEYRKELEKVKRWNIHQWFLNQL